MCKNFSYSYQQSGSFDVMSKTFMYVSMLTKLAMGWKTSFWNQFYAFRQQKNLLWVWKMCSRWAPTLCGSGTKNCLRQDWGYRNQGLIKTANESRYLKKNKQNIVDPSNAGKSEMYKVTEWCDSPVEKQTGSDVNTDTLLVVWLAARLTELKS